MQIISTIMAIGLMLMATFKSLDLISTYQCQEEKAYEVYFHMHQSLNAKIDNKEKKVSCLTDSFFQNRISITNKNNIFQIKYKSNKPIQYDFKQKLVKDEFIKKPTSK